MSTDLTRHALNGPTMGTRWSALFWAAPELDPTPLRTALQAATSEVDAQMSTWQPDSDLMRLNAAEPMAWVEVPSTLMAVLEAALEVGRASDGAFDIGVGDAVRAWGFGPSEASATAIREALYYPRRPAHDLLDLDPEASRVRKRAPVILDLSGIAKGYGVDQMAGAVRAFDIADALVAIDGEVRAMGRRPGGAGWSVAIERPDPEARAPHAIIDLRDAAVATSGDYRHRVDAGGRHLSHTMDPARGGPLAASPASVTVVAATGMAADAWATALMVLGSLKGAELARKRGLDALFIDRDGDALRETRVGHLFEDPCDPVAGPGPKEDAS